MIGVIVCFCTAEVTVYLKKKSDQNLSLRMDYFVLESKQKTIG